MSKLLSERILPVAGALLTLIFAGCSDSVETELHQAEDASSGPVKVVLQTDWFPQPEHGGFYQALVEGYYQEEGLDVEIRPGGPNVGPDTKVALGQADFALQRSDQVILAASRGLPLVMVGAMMQKDAQGIMVHQGSGIESWQDLDGRSIMAIPGSLYLQLLEKKLGVRMSVIPHDFGMERFIADKDFVQQCFVTNEPFYVAQKGAHPKTFLLSDAGINPYRVWYTRRSFARQSPDVVAAFTRASVRGWREYLFGDRSQADAVISGLNPKMTPEFIEFSVNKMIDQNLVTGDSGDPEAIGKLERSRISAEIEEMAELGLLENVPAVGVIYTDRFLPESTRNFESAVTSSVLLRQAAQPGDIAIFSDLDADPGFISTESISELGSSIERIQLEMTDGPVEVESVDLSVLLEATGIPLENDDLLMITCSDGYTSFFDPRVILSNRPIVVLGVEGIPFPQWAIEKENPKWAPAIIMVTDKGGLFDPDNKMPWGVERLTRIPGSRLASLREKLVGDASAERGFQLYVGNCASCHALNNPGIGGTVSNRTGIILAAHALGNTEYFRSILRDPSGTNPIAARMPAMPHYGPDEVAAIQAFLKIYSE